MHQGYIKLFRKLQQWEWYTDSTTLHLFIHLIIGANHKPKQWQGIEILRGQFIAGRKSLSEQTGISEQSIRTALNNLKATHEITVKSTNKYSVITICNYDTYQNCNIETNQQLTNNQPATNQQLTTTNNDKNDKNDKNTTSTSDSLNDKLSPVSPKKKSIPEDSLAYLWNSICTNLPKVIEYSTKRENKEKVRLKEREIDSWKEVFTKLNNSSWCKGDNDRGWKATYDWIILESDNSIKTLEGKYDDKISKPEDKWWS